MNINYKLYLYKPAGTDSDFLGELLADNVNAQIKLHDISTISFSLPETINGFPNPRIDEVLDSYIVELRYGKDIISETSYENGDYSKIRFTIYSTPLEFNENKKLYNYSGYSLESLLEFKHITNWGGVEVKDFFRTIKYNNTEISQAFTEPGSFSYSISTSANAAGTKYITVEPTTLTAKPLDIFIYEVRQDTSVSSSRKEVPYVRYTGVGVDDSSFREGYYFLELDVDLNVEFIKIAVPENYDLFDGLPSNKELFFKLYDNPLSRHFAIGVNRNAEDPYTDMYIELAKDAAEGDDTPEFGDYTFSSQSIYSKNGLKLEQVLLGKTDIVDPTEEDPTADGLLYSTQFTIGYIDPVIAAMYRSNLEFNNITRYQAIKDLAESFDAIVVYDTVAKTVSFYPQDNTLTNVWPNNGLIIKYGTYLKSITKEIDSSKIVTSAKALGKNNIGISLITPDGKDSWEDFSYYLDDHYVEFDPENLLTISNDNTTGIAYTSFPSGTSSRWMDETEAQKVAKWQYARDYFHSILLGELDPAITQHDRYVNLYNLRSEALNDYVAAESEFIAWRAEQLKYKYLYDYYYNLKQNGTATSDDLLRLAYYTKIWFGPNGNDGAEAAVEEKAAELEEKRKEIYDETITDSLADKLSEVRAFLSKSVWTIDEAKLQPFIRQAVMSDNKHDNEYDLLKATITHVNENKSPKVTLKTNIISIISAQEAYEDWNKLQTGHLINIYFDEFSIDLVAQIKEISIDFEQHTVDLTISTVHNYNTGYGKYVARTLRRLHNSDTNITKNLEDANRISSEESDQVYKQLTNGVIRADNSRITFGATDNTGKQSTSFSGSGGSSLIISAIDPVLETITFNSNRGVSIADGTITAYIDRGDGDIKTEVEISGANGFAIRNTDNDTGTVETVAYIDQADGSAYFAGWELQPDNLNSNGIKLYSGTSPYLSVDQGTEGYGNDGIFLGIESSNPKFSMVTDSGNTYLKYDPSATYDLQVEGNAKIGPLFIGNTSASTGTITDVETGDTLSITAPTAATRTRTYTFSPSGKRNVTSFSISYANGIALEISLRVFLYYDTTLIETYGYLLPASTTSVINQSANFIATKAVIELRHFGTGSGTVSVSSATFTENLATLSVGDLAVYATGNIFTNKYQTTKISINENQISSYGQNLLVSADGLEINGTEGTLTDGIVLQGSSSVGSNTRRITLTTPTSALAASRTIRFPDFAGTLVVSSSTSQGGILYASSSTGYQSTAAGTTGQVLISAGTSAPTWNYVLQDISNFSGAVVSNGATAVTIALDETLVTSALYAIEVNANTSDSAEGRTIHFFECPAASDTVTFFQNDHANASGSTTIYKFELFNSAGALQIDEAYQHLIGTSITASTGIRVWRVYRVKSHGG